MSRRRRHPPDTVKAGTVRRHLAGKNEVVSSYRLPVHTSSCLRVSRFSTGFKCWGEEEIVRDDQELLCTKYRITSKQIVPMDARVDSDHIPQRLLIDRRKIMDLVQD